ncbi:MAG: DUF4368 domain-containing protein, partial [Synergistaceae bacterium]|nr:DUF4368 domain-containing protein [Synergistaceae bacterium]
MRHFSVQAEDTASSISPARKYPKTHINRIFHHHLHLHHQEQAELRDKIELLENEIQNQEDHAENVDRFIRQAKKYLYLEKLTPTI